MSRYKKASMNESELPEIDGMKPILRPTRDEKMSVIELFMDQQKNKGLDIRKATKVLTDLLYNSLFLWEGKNRTNKKEEGNEDIDRDDVEDYVVKNVFELWLEVLNALEIIDKKKLEQLQKEQEAKLKAEQEQEDPN
jgi:hypothetical protein